MTSDRKGRRVTRAGAAVAELTRIPLPASIRVVNEAERIIEVCATSEAVDTFDTVFDYEASKEAFQRWAGNVREMHERKAVGRRVEVRCDDATRKVFAQVRISKGANDTWEKIKDGTLDGASIGASNVVWKAERRAGQVRQVAKSYDLMELSLVDLASNPDSRGIAFVRDGVPDALLLEDVSNVAAGSPVVAEAAASASLGSSHSANTSRIIEDGGSLSNEDVTASIARTAFARGQAQAQAPSQQGSPQLTAYQQKLARLGAPVYAARAAGSSAGEVNVEGEVQVGPSNPQGDTLGGVAPGEGAMGLNVGQPLDLDGDHEMASDYVAIQSGPTAGAVMAPSPAGSVAHMAHNHHHTGVYDDPSDHREISAHMHRDGTQHAHEHMMDHRHGDHTGFPAGHAHPHVHIPEHEHYYRVASGAPLDARCVTVDQARTYEVVSELAFHAAGGVSGRPLSVAQFRLAQGFELRLAQADAARALGPYSRNPGGPADAGTPAQAQQHPTEALTGEATLGDGNGGVPAISGISDMETELFRTGRCPLCQGQIRALDRDGQPIAGGNENPDPNGAANAAVSSTGTLDVSAPPDGWSGRAALAQITRAVETSMASQFSRIVSEQQASRNAIEQRLARIEAQPAPSSASGGPMLRGADKMLALSPSGSGASTAERIAVLESLAGRLADPQAQMAVASEMIRLQQEERGIPATGQIMPRAGGGLRG